GVVCGGSSERATPGIIDALVGNKLRITRLLDRIAIVLNKERPAQEIVFGSDPGTRGYLVNDPGAWIDSICLWPQGVEAGFEKGFFETFSGQTGSKRSPSRP